ncbi:MAG: family 10 glycosylhydrolase [Bacillus sp. (in: Bacteria)]|nr:family 10 glycosylhydrolase [Bacillus sp. (in: firmicutes)]
MRKRLKVITGFVLASSLVFSSFAFNKSALAVTESPVKLMTIEDQSGDHIAIDGINQLSNDNKLIIFNDTFSYYTETQIGSLEVVLEKVGLNEYRIVTESDGDSAIPENGMVLSTGDVTTLAIKDFLSQLEHGEVVTLIEPVEKIEQLLAQAIDPTSQSNPDGAVFDGYRGPDQLIVYTPSFGETTKTNPYGYEITVENGFVTKLGGGNFQIPRNGFVISGHGVASKWISSNSIIGAKVMVDENGLVEIIQDVDSFQFQSRQAIDQAKASIEKAKVEFLEVAMKEANNSIQQAEELIKVAEALKKNDPVKALDAVRKATQAAYDAYYFSLPSNVAEQRAIWYRPEETTLDGVKQVLDRMEEAGFNSVYLETTFHGYTIYPSRTMQSYGLPAQHPRFEKGEYGPYGKDLLDAYIQEGKKRGLTIQAWTDGFMVGHSSLGMSPQFMKYPEWAAIQRNNTSGQPAPDTTSNYYWLDIAQPEVQTFMLDIYKEMQSNYDIKGLNIDYMRYPHQKFEQSYGFSENIQNLYKDQFGIDPYDINPTSTPEQWKSWEEWLRLKENIFIDKLHEQLKGINSKFMLTATPEPGPEAVLISDWKDDLDGVIPQAYGHDFNSIQKTVQDSKKLMPEGTMYYTGIYSFYHHLSEMASVNDVISAKHNTSGVNMFAFGQASAPSVDALGKGPWREQAINPGEEPILATLNLLMHIEKQFNQIYIKQGAVDQTEGILLKQTINDVRKIVRTNPENSEESFNHAISQINKALESKKLNSIVGERVKNQLMDSKLWVNYGLNQQK